MSKNEQLSYAQVSKEIRDKWPVRSVPPMTALDYMAVLEDVSVVTLLNDITSMKNQKPENITKSSKIDI